MRAPFAWRRSESDDPNTGRDHEAALPSRGARAVRQYGVRTSAPVTRPRKPVRATGDGQAAATGRSRIGCLSARIEWKHHYAASPARIVQPRCGGTEFATASVLTVTAPAAGDGRVGERTHRHRTRFAPAAAPPCQQAYEPPPATDTRAARTVLTTTRFDQGCAPAHPATHDTAPASEPATGAPATARCRHPHARHAHPRRPRVPHPHFPTARAPAPAPAPTPAPTRATPRHPHWRHARGHPRHPHRRDAHRPRTMGPGIRTARRAHPQHTPHPHRHRRHARGPAHSPPAPATRTWATPGTRTGDTRTGPARWAPASVPPGAHPQRTPHPHPHRHRHRRRAHGATHHTSTRSTGTTRPRVSPDPRRSRMPPQQRLPARRADFERLDFLGGHVGAHRDPRVAVRGGCPGGQFGLRAVLADGHQQVPGAA